MRSKHLLSLVQKKQLQRELTCLERQLERLKKFDGDIDQVTFETYQEMIDTRQKLLSDAENTALAKLAMP